MCVCACRCSCTVADDSDDVGLFDEGVDPLALLEQMERAGATAVEAAGGDAWNPLEVLRQRRLQMRGSSSGEYTSATANTDHDSALGSEGDVAGPSAGFARATATVAARGRGRGRGRPPGSGAHGRAGRKPRGGAAAGGLFGADVDDFLGDPLAERVGLAPIGSARGVGRRRQRRSRRRAKGVKARGMPEEVSERTVLLNHACRRPSREVQQ
jgi:hypothetical protein